MAIQPLQLFVAGFTDSNFLASLVLVVLAAL